VTTGNGVSNTGVLTIGEVSGLTGLVATAGDINIASDQAITIDEAVDTSAGNGNVTITAADVDLSGTIDAGSGSITVAPSQAGTAIVFGEGSVSGGLVVPNSYVYEESGDSTVGGGVNGDASGSELTDGNLVATTSFNDANFVGFHDPAPDNGLGQPKVNFDFGTVTSFESIAIRYLHSTTQAAGTISAPESAFVSFSDDGTTFSTPIQFTTEFDSSAGDAVRTATLDVSGNSGWFVRVDVKQSGPWTFLDEVSFQAAGGFLSDAELDQLTTTNRVIVGSATSGDISFGSTISPANADTLEIITGGSVNAAGVSPAISVTNLAITAAQGIGTTSVFNLDADNLAASVGSGDLRIADPANIVISTVAGLSGLTSTGSGDVSVAAGGSIVVSQPVQAAGSGSVLLTTSGLTGSNISPNASITTDTGNLTIAAANNVVGNVSTITTSSGIVTFRADADSGSSGSSGSIQMLNPISLGSGSLVIDTPNDSTTFSGPVSGTGGITRIGAGVITWPAIYFSSRTTTSTRLEQFPWQETSTTERGHERQSLQRCRQHRRRPFRNRRIDPGGGGIARPDCGQHVFRPDQRHGR